MHTRAALSFRFHPPQLAIGPAGSGAPPHYHADALNVLVRGRKRWLLWRPRRSFMSTRHPQGLLAQLDEQRQGREHERDREGNQARTSPAILRQFEPDAELEQEEGDVLYIPEGWGHAVLNMEPSTAIAAEFVRAGSAG